ncbi:aminotransferase class III-fold pyridoxal phosphate-dependent enzyme [bacterium]|nr:aminotransferase class III-fold pyridoxal phosphate-dependent enzyme [bacterium]
MDASHLATLRRLDEAHLLHPFTDHLDLHRQGTHVIEQAAGCHVTDETGRRLLDGLAGLWCVNVGYGRREIADAVHRQMASVCYYPSFFNTTTEPTILLADKIAAAAPPGLGKVFFSNSGSEANETALKLIRAYHKLRGRPGKTKILTRSFSYHGVGLATTSMTGLPTCTEPFDLPLPGFLHVPGPHPYGVDSDLSPAAFAAHCLAETERVIAREGADTIAALFAEPVQGAGGVIVPPPGHLRALRDLCRRHDILFVADEVITGFGRLGAWFASVLWDLEPDLLTLAKGITSGYVPLGATLVSEAMTEVFERGGYLAHGFTYSGHPVATAAGLANLEILERERLIERVRDDVGPYFQQRLRALAGHPVVGEIRGEQLIGAVDLLPRGGRSARQTPPVLGARAVALARAEGLIVRGIRDLIAIAPPLIVSREEIDFIFATVGRVLDRLWD